MAGGASKYGLIVDQLVRDIREGRYRIGDALPTETDLMRDYGVSRHTVRSAIQVLRNRGMIVSRQGQGTKVVSDGQTGEFIERIQTIHELIEFGEETRRHLIDWKTITADDDLAACLGISRDRRLLEVTMLRTPVDRPDRPFAHLMLWMDALFETVVQELESESNSVAGLLQRNFDLETRVVRQTVGAGLLDERISTLLGRPAQTASLIIDRRYAEHVDGPSFLRARSICAADVVQLESTFQAKASGEA